MEALHICCVTRNDEKNHVESKMTKKMMTKENRHQKSKMTITPRLLRARCVPCSTEHSTFCTQHRPSLARTWGVVVAVPSGPPLRPRPRLKGAAQPAGQAAAALEARSTETTGLNGGSRVSLLDSLLRARRAGGSTGSAPSAAGPQGHQTPPGHSELSSSSTGRPCPVLRTVTCLRVRLGFRR